MYLVSKVTLSFYKLQGYKTVSGFSRREKPEKLPVCFCAVLLFLHLKKEQNPVCDLGPLHLDESSSAASSSTLLLLGGGRRVLNYCEELQWDRGNA